MSSPADKNSKSWYERVPKVELHLHLQGAIPSGTLLKLIQNYGGDPAAWPSHLGPRQRSWRGGSIWGPIHGLHVKRIGHGGRADENEKLLDYLAEKQIPQELCPLRNICT